MYPILIVFHSLGYVLFHMINIIRLDNNLKRFDHKNKIASAVLIANVQSQVSSVTFLLG